MKPKTHNIVFFTGSGISEESGVQTFRGNNGLWYEYKIEEVASIEGWRKNPGKVIEFYNKRRKAMNGVLPNKAHKAIGELYSNEQFKVSVITQNVDDLHEKGGAKDVIHLHGRLDELRCSKDSTLIYPYVKDLKSGDECADGHQLRPNIVWFGENLNTNDLETSAYLVSQADYLVIVGTSLQVFPAAGLVYKASKFCSIYYVEPEELENFDIHLISKPTFHHIQEKATKGVKMVIEEIMKNIS